MTMYILYTLNVHRLGHCVLSMAMGRAYPLGGNALKEIKCDWFIYK